MTTYSDLLDRRVGRCRAIDLVTLAVIVVTLSITAIIVVTGK